MKPPAVRHSHNRNILCLVCQDEVEIQISVKDQAAEAYANALAVSLTQLTDYCCDHTGMELTVSDLTFSELPPQLLEKLQQVHQVEDIYTLSPMQEGMLFHALIDNGQGYYFAQVIFSINGILNATLVEGSMNHLIARYSILRSIFLNEGFSRPIQVVLKERKIDFLYLDVREAYAQGDSRQVIQYYQAQDKERSFDLGADVLMRLTVLQTRDNEYELIWSYHHIIMDGWCMGIIFQDFVAMYSQLAYSGKVILPPAKPYAEFIKWLGQKDKKDAEAYWSGYLEGYDTLAAFPKRRTVGNEEMGFTKGTSTVQVSGESMLRLNELTARLGVTLNTLVQAAWGILLSRYNAKDDVVFAAVVSGRPDEIEGVENMVGLFINSIPVRVKYNRDDSVEDLLRQLQLKALESAQHSHYPLSEIQALSEMGRGLLDHIMAFENLPMAEKLKDERLQERNDPGFRVTRVQEFERPNYDLWIIVNPGDELQINLNYNAELYDAGFMQRAAGHFEQIIRHIIDKTQSRVGEIEILTVPEQHQILFEFNNTATPYAHDLLMHQLFERRTRISPGLSAIVSGGKDYSYDWLNKRSNTLAHYLRQRGVTCGTSVVVIMNRSIELIVALYAILKAGGKYVPVEPDLPEPRTLSILNSVEATMIITNADNMETSAGLKKKTPSVASLISLGVLQDAIVAEEITGEGKNKVGLSGYSHENPAPLCSSEDLAYVIFTSGSTGNPKGVAVQHKPAINLIEWVNKQYSVSAEDKILLVSSISFDLSVYDIFGGLAAGACIRIADEHDLSDPEVLADIVIDEGITFWDSAPAMLQQVIPFLEKRKEEAKRCGKLRISFSSGDWIPLTMPPQMQQLFKDYQFVGLGGATEATIWSNYFEVGKMDPSWSSIPYGKPIQNAKYLVLDSYLNLCPIGVQGNLFIGGECLAKEYINDKELSDRKFIESPFYAGEKLYNTGDTARWFPDGNLEFMGRKDAQVKVRGYRIELGEIESVLCKFPGIDQVLAHALSRTKYDKFICAYYQSSQVFGKEELQQYVGRSLPEYMVPSYFVRIDEIPVTKNGKLDRKRLPDPQVEMNTSHIERPQSQTQNQLLQMWAKLLHLSEDRFGVTHDFFQLGGHSVMAVHLIGQIYETFDVRIKLREIFEHPTIGELAALIDPRKGVAETMIPKLAKQDLYVTSSAQERMFFAHMQAPHSLAYNIVVAYEIKGEADENTIARCLQALIDRHESLRTSFILNADGVNQQVYDQVKVDLAVGELHQHTTLSEAFSAFVEPFDLASRSLIRFRLLKTMDQAKFFLVNVHHIVCDGISLNILMNEFKQLYKGGQLEALDTRYVDYAQWQKTAKGELDRQKEYWLNQLSGGLPTLALPAYRSRDLVDIAPAASQNLTIDGELYKRIKQFNSGANVSDFMFLLSVYQILLSKIAGSTDVVVATDVVGRTHPQLANIVGTFINILPLRMQVKPGRTFRNFLEDVRKSVLDAYDNQDFQFDWMVSELKKADPNEPATIADVHFSMANYYSSKVEIEDLFFEPVRMQSKLTTQYEFKLEVLEMDGRFIVQFIYSTGLYDAETIEALITYYMNILTAVIANHEVKLEEIDISERGPEA